MNTALIVAEALRAFRRRIANRLAYYEPPPAGFVGRPEWKIEMVRD